MGFKISTSSPALHPILLLCREYLVMEALSKKSEKFEEIGNLVLHSREVCYPDIKLFPPHTSLTSPFQDIPIQQNSSDCGVFMCQYAEYVSRRVPVNFAQSNMAYFRRRMVWEICTGKLMSPVD